MTVLVYLHPLAGALTIALLLYAGALGLRARNTRRGRAELLRRHARIAPVMFWSNLASWLGGLFSTWAWRPEMELAASMHVRIGAVMLLVLSASFLVSRNMNSELTRNFHTLLGCIALLLAVAQVFFGLQITP